MSYSGAIQQLNKAIEKEMTEWKIPGISIILIDNDETVWAKGYGYTDNTSIISVNPYTPFKLESMTKTYTTYGFLAAIEKGLVKLDDLLKTYVPEFTVNSKFEKNDAEKITFRQLLSHRSGLCHETSKGNEFIGDYCSFDEHIKSIFDTWLLFSPGERYSYSDLGIDLVGYALERITGKPFHQYMKETVFDPLRMKTSSLDEKKVLKDRTKALGHEYGWELQHKRLLLTPSGGMYSSAHDIGEFMKYLLVGHKVEANPIVGNMLVCEMYKPQFPVRDQVSGAGLGVFTCHNWGTQVHFHNGGGDGFFNSQKWINEYGLGAVVLTNERRHNFVCGRLVDKALSLMLEVKLGKIPVTKPTYYQLPSIAAPTDKQLQTFQGNYEYGYSFKILENGILGITSGNSGKYMPLKSIDTNDFCSEDDQRYVFNYDSEAKVRGVTIYNNTPGPVEYLPFIKPEQNSIIGPNKSEWNKYIGQYVVKGCKLHKSLINKKWTINMFKISKRNIYHMNICIKDGFLYDGNIRLDEYRTGLFFSTSQIAWEFKGNKALRNNMVYKRVPAMIGKFYELLTYFKVKPGT